MKWKIMEETKKYQYDYWRPAVAADNVVYRFEGKELQVLLVKRGNDPFKGKWALPGGFGQPSIIAKSTAATSRNTGWPWGW